MGVYSDLAKSMYLEEEAKSELEQKKVQNSYNTNLFYGGAQVVVIARNDKEAQLFEKLATADFERFSREHRRELGESVDHIEFDGDKFTIVKESLENKIKEKNNAIRESTDQPTNSKETDNAKPNEEQEQPESTPNNQQNNNDIKKENAEDISAFIRERNNIIESNEEDSEDGEEPVDEAVIFLSNTGKELKTKLKQIQKDLSNKFNLRNLFKGGFNKAVAQKVFGEVKKVGTACHIGQIQRIETTYSSEYGTCTVITYENIVNIVYKGCVFNVSYSMDQAKAAMKFLGFSEVKNAIYPDDVAKAAIGIMTDYENTLVFKKSRITVDGVTDSEVNKLIDRLNAKYKGKYTFEKTKLFGDIKVKKLSN